MVDSLGLDGIEQFLGFILNHLRVALGDHEKGEQCQILKLAAKLQINIGDSLDSE